MDYSPIALLYQLQYENYADDLEFYTRLAQDYGGPVLELGAGTGRVARALARLGLEVWALEPAEEMRKLGARHTRDLKVKWLPGDMRRLELGRQFPLIIAPFNALMHLYTLEEQDQALQGIAAHLEKGGRFAFDLYNPAHIGPAGVLQHEGSYGPTQVFLYQEHHPIAQALLTHYLVDTTSPKGHLRRQHHTLTQRYYTRYELERWLRAFAFGYRLYGGFHKEPLLAESPVFVVEAWRS
ncbi:class I SAM-dependent methyltransferase [Meiothermus rufus]|uniref:class I SAM-dependent methyltransferase n=1 Tax=Meiothermus rufus TaxID=604332 RepID=UPI00041F8AE2|nr:class I SAM-dependent methyltransferase [Meiothermus rufus]